MVRPYVCHAGRALKARFGSKSRGRPLDVKESPNKDSVSTGETYQHGKAERQDQCIPGPRITSSAVAISFIAPHQHPNKSNAVYDACDEEC